MKTIKIYTDTDYLTGSLQPTDYSLQLHLQQKETVFYCCGWVFVAVAAVQFGTGGAENDYEDQQNKQESRGAERHENR